MVALAELDIVVAGRGNPHIQEADGVVVVGHPAVTGHGVVAVLPGVQEGVPLLVLQVHGDAHGSQSSSQVLTDGLVGIGGIVQVGQGGEVGELTGGLVVVVVLAQDVDGLCEVVLVGILSHIPVAVEAVVVAGVLVELGAVSVGHAHGYEGGSGDLTGLGDLLDDVVTIVQQGDGVADLGLSSSLLFRSHVAGVDLAGVGRGFGGSVRGSGSGSRGFRLGTASSHAQNHDGSQEQSNEFFHFSFSFLNSDFYLQIPVGI